MKVTCEQCREQMLDYLYGLLDLSESSAFAAHLASCPACTSAHAESVNLQRQIRQAACGSFPTVTFVPPVELAEPRRTRASWQRYASIALVAAVLIAVTAIALELIPPPVGSEKGRSFAGIQQPNLTTKKLPDDVRFPPLLTQPEGVEAGFMVSLTLDKANFQAGDSLFFRSLTVDRKTMKPLQNPANVQLRFELRSPDGKQVIVKSSDVIGVENPLLDAKEKEFEPGLKFGSIMLPPMLADGQYRLVALELPNGEVPVATAIVNVGSTRPQSLAMKLVFNKPSYRLGDTVSATVTVTKDGKPYANKQFQVEATHANNQELATVDPIGMLDANGTVTITLTLPKTGEVRSPMIKIRMLDQDNQSITQEIPLMKP